MPRKTASEIKADLDKALSAIETEIAAPVVEPPKEEPKKEEVKVEEPQAKAEEPVRQVEAPVVAEPAPVEQKTEEPDYKKKFVESTRESQILASRNRKMTEVLEQADQLPDPTPEELKAQFPDWELIDPVQQILIKDSIKNKKIFSMLGQVTKESKDIEAWNAKVDEFVSDPKTLIQYPDLEGKQDELKVYATKATRRGVEFDDIVASFLFSESKTKTKSKGSMFQAPTAGPSTPVKPKTDKITMAEAIVLKKTNFNKYKEFLIAGKIDNSELQ